ncbi:MAG: PQQ-binding-like beta-propeller repeat protein [Anaerolineae bacterium]
MSTISKLFCFYQKQFLITVSLLICIFVLTTTASSARASLQASTDLNSMQASASAAANFSDWPRPHYDAQRSNYNIFETDLQPPFNETPTNVRYNPAEITRITLLPAVANGQFLWSSVIQSLDDTDFLAATDLQGNKQWQLPLPTENLSTRANSPIIDGDTVYLTEFILTKPLAEDKSELVARNHMTGAEKWRHPISITSSNSNQNLGAAVLEGDHIYIGWTDDNGEYISKIRKTDGSTLWTIEPDNSGSRTADFMAVINPSTGNNILTVVHFNTVVGYSTQNGSELWQYDTNDGFNFVSDVEELLIHDTNGYIVHDEAIIAIDLTNGSNLWEQPFENDCDDDSDPGMATDGTRLFVSGVCNTQLAAYSLSSGIEEWRNEIGRSFGFNRSIAVANGYVYVEGYDDSEGSILSAFMTNGTPAQTINLAEVIDTANEFWSIESLMVANGQLYASWRDATSEGGVSIWGEGTGTGRLYLDEYDDDAHPTTNPTEDAIVPLVKRDGEYGVEISVAAKIGNLPARLVVYNNNGSIYKETTSEPNPFGYGYFLAPLEYTADGYEYQIILDNGDELPKRKINFPANPESNLEAIIDTDGLAWQAPPNSITTASAVLTANLPAGFPAGTTESTLYLQESGRGAVTLDGVRTGDQIQFTIDQNNGLNGDFVATAIAQSGNQTAYSNDLNLKIDSAVLPDVRVQATSAIIPQTDGTYNAYTYSFERERPTIDPATTADVQIASIVPDPAGYQVTLLVRTPPATMLDPLTQKWDVSVKGVDQAGNSVSFVTEEINATPEGIYVPLYLPQTGGSPIVRIEAYGSTLEGATRSGELGLRLSLAPTAGGCSPGSPPPSQGPNNGKPLKVSDIININIDAGVAGEAVSGAGVGGATYVQREVLSGQLQACVEAGGRVGGGVGGGPMGAVGLALNLRGSGHEAPASSGIKFDVTGQAGLGVQLSYSVPSNWGKGGYGTIGLAVSGAPAAKVTGGISGYSCKPKPKDEGECCKGNRCAPPPPDPPGNDHPDDTQSVVINRLSSLNNTANENSNHSEYWSQVLRFASREGLQELTDYAIFRLADGERLNQIVDYPVGTALTADQQAVVARQEAERVAQAAQLATQWATIEAQLDLLEAIQANVLANGYYQQMSDMLTGYGIPSRFVTPDFSPDALKDSLLVIPTAGLYGLSGNPTFAARLERFVNQGGTLLVMAQPEDNGFDLLPGNWTAVGYQNDQSCWTAAMTPVAQHPMLSSINQPTVKANVDGYMTAWPNTAELLLKRTKNDQGSFVLDRVGDGHMIVTNMYDDWGRTVGQSSGQVRNLFRDVARWALTADDNMPTTDLNKAVTIPLTLTNLTSQSAAQVRYTVRRANGTVQNSGPGTVPLSLATGKAVEKSVSVTPTTADYGLWSISYTLLDSVGNDLGGETFGRYFAVNGQTVRAADFGQLVHTVQAPQVPVAATVTAEVSFDNTAYASNDTVQASIAINVSGDSGGQLRISASLGNGTQEKIVPANNQTVNFSFPADFSGGGLFYFGIFDDATDQGLHLDTSWVQPAGTTASITPDKVRYAPGETVTLNVSGSYSGTVTVDGPDFSDLFTVTSGAPSAQTTLPTAMASGSYSVQYSESGQLVTAHFDVAGPQITVLKMGINNAVADADETVSVTADVSSNQPLNVIVVGRMVDAAGNEVGVYSENKSLTNGEQQIVMPVEVLTTAAGTVRYDITVLDAADESVIHATAHRFISLDLPQLLGLNTEGGTIATNQANLTVDFYSPSGQTVMLVVEVDGVSIFSKSVSIPAGFSSQSIPLPSSLDKGGHSVFMQATVGSLSSEKTASFVVDDALPQPNGAIYLPLIVR